MALTVEQCWQRVPGGSGTYIAELAAALRGRSDTAVEGLAARHNGPPNLPLPPGMPVAMATLPRRALYDSWNTLRLPRAEGVVSADLVHATTWAIPPSRLPLVATVHDLAFSREPSHFTARGVRYFRRSLARVVAEASRVIVPSRATWSDCVAHGLDPARLRLVPHGVRVTHRTDRDVAEFRTRFGLSRPYALWTGTLEPRKNLPTLLAAFRKASVHVPIDLVLVGPTGWGERPLPTALDDDRVHRLGHLSDVDLQTAYAGAALFAYPSLWEGFGLPVLEAMAHGVPVVTSQGTSMAEVVGDAGLLVPATDVDALATAIRSLVSDTLGHDLGERGRRLAAAYTWEAAADATRAVYLEALG